MAWLIATTLAYLPVAQAENSGTYIGFDYSNMIVKFPQSVTTPKLQHTERMVRARIGVMLFPEAFPGLALESHLAMGATGEDVNYDSTDPNVGNRDTQLELETIIGLYVRGDFYSSDGTSLYGMLGLASAQSGPRRIAPTTQGEQEITEPETESGLSYGLGFTYAYSDKTSLQLEFMSVARKTTEAGFDVSGVSVGFNVSLD